MNAANLYRIIGNQTSPDDEVELEVGGDGAIHTSPIRSVRREGDTFILSGENE